MCIIQHIDRVFTLKTHPSSLNHQLRCRIVLFHPSQPNPIQNVGGTFWLYSIKMHAGHTSQKTVFKRVFWEVKSGEKHIYRNLTLSRNYPSYFHSSKIQIHPNTLLSKSRHLNSKRVKL